MPNALRFRQWKTPKQAGERARLKIVHGPDMGSVFVVTVDKFTVGRGDENDVVIADLRASRKHAELVRAPNATHWRLKDLGSQNGFVLNGKVTREADLRAGDVVTIGETAFEFVPDGTGAQFLQTTPRAVTKEQLYGTSGRALAIPAAAAPIKRAPVADFSGMAGIAGMGASSGSHGDSSEKRKKILIGVVVLMGVWLFMEDPAPQKGAPKDTKTAKKEKDKEKEKEAQRDLASYLPPLASTGGASSAETFFQEGFREFREKNYLRARVQFETSLQINPTHSLARSFLKECDKQIEENVQAHLDRGRRDLDAGKLKSARAHFEAVKRLLSRDTENPSFLEARDQLRSVEMKFRSGGGES